MKNLVLALTLIITAAVSQADTLKVNANVSISNGTTTYSMASNGIYYIQSQQGSTTTEITSNKTSPQITTKDASENMPDSSKGEYTTISLQKHEGNQGLMILDVTQSYEGQLIRFYQPVEVQLISGSWADYDNGSTVQLALTEQGVQSMTQFKKSLAGRFNSLLSQTLQKGGSKMKNFELSFEKQSTGSITASKSTLILSGNETVFHVKCELSL
jgi:hypothetical protein